MKRSILLSVLTLIISLSATAQRTTTSLTQWQFFRETSTTRYATPADLPAKVRPGKVGANVTVPHDWAISGPFDKEIDKQVVAIEQNGEKEATEKTGRSGSLPWIGSAWYRTTATVPADAERVILNFDGAMSEPEVYVNGKRAGEWKYGYTPFNIDITPYINHDGTQNVIAVHLQNIEESSRWYPGAGLYRPVTLITTPATAIEEWSLVANTLTLQGADAAAENAASAVADPQGESAGLCSADLELNSNVIGMLPGKAYSVEYTITGDGFRHSVTQPVAADGSAHVITHVSGIHPWTPETPALYTLTAVVTCSQASHSQSHSQQPSWSNSRRSDLREYDPQAATATAAEAATTHHPSPITQKIGFRTVRMSAPWQRADGTWAGGFELNGVSRKIKGVCLHHDLGMLGSAVNRDAIIRQVMLLKSMGCDAIRTSHNMPSQMQMDICDSLGMMVMAESFDMWVYPKCKNGYARFFKDWSDLDIRNLVQSNRLHPSIVMWSVGNEIPEQGSADGARMLRHLQDVVHQYDVTRPITNGMDKITNALKSGFAQVAEVPGMNYRTHLYRKAYDGLGQGYVLGSETASTVSSRGVYKFPVVRADGKAYADGQCSSYDTEACWWSNIPEDDWLLQDECPWVVGEFVWTGFDYLGEPTPYDEYWPSRSSYFGIFDLAGLPKDRYYLYRSRWNTGEPTVHLLPHWTWPGREGEVTPVYCYTSYPTAELFVNGRSMGKRTKRTDVTMPAGKDGRITEITDPALDRYRLRWNDVRYEPGELRVVCYDAAGNKAAEEVVRTAGKPSRLVLTPFCPDSPTASFMPSDTKTQAIANGTDGNTLFYTVSIVDADGNLCPDADNSIKVDVKGAATFRAICNGDATSVEVFTHPQMHAFHGQLVFAVDTKQTAGNINIKVTSPGLKAATMN